MAVARRILRQERPAAKPVVSPVAKPAAKPLGRVAVVDVGSNSVRLVVYDELSRAPIPTFNEKVLCGLGRGIAGTGALDPAGMESALSTLMRFAALARGMDVSLIDVVATAAVREASNGAAFVREIERRCKLKVRVLSGMDEARLSAEGLLAAIPGAIGMMGDLGGGSLELVCIDGQARQRIGSNVTLPLGPLRLMDGGGLRSQKLKRTIDRTLEEVDWLSTLAGRTLYIVGGAWRALARIDMEVRRYPLHVIHHYAVPARDMMDVAELIAGLGRESLQRIEAVPRERMDTLPLASLTLARLLRAAKPNRVVFSAWALREGVLLSHLGSRERAKDPLIAAARHIAEHPSRDNGIGQALFAFTAPLFPNEAPEQARLREAACHLAEIGWRLHPDYRGELAFQEVLRAPIVGLDHPSRIMLALAVHARYRGGIRGEVSEPYRRLIEASDQDWARVLGLGLRLGVMLSGGMPALLGKCELRREAKRLRLIVSRSAGPLVGDQVVKRLDGLARAIGGVPEVQLDA
jgi:exopolyphosphatase / guanosine-5'-triphosphate,3'-diphosphate pyrophosphatase